MAVWLLTWNPDRWKWDNYEEECEGLSKIGVLRPAAIPLALAMGI